jgi:hypothetical protein
MLESLWTVALTVQFIAAAVSSTLSLQNCKPKPRDVREDPVGLCEDCRCLRKPLSLRQMHPIGFAARNPQIVVLGRVSAKQHSRNQTSCNDRNRVPVHRDCPVLLSIVLPSTRFVPV